MSCNEHTNYVNDTSTGLEHDSITSFEIDNAYHNDKDDIYTTLHKCLDSITIGENCQIQSQLDLIARAFILGIVMADSIRIRKKMRQHRQDVVNREPKDPFSDETYDRGKENHDNGEKYLVDEDESIVFSEHPMFQELMADTIE